MFANDSSLNRICLKKLPTLHSPYLYPKRLIVVIALLPFPPLLHNTLISFFRVTFTIPLCTDKRNGAFSSLCTLKAVPSTSILACSVSIQKGCPCFFATSKNAFPCRLTSRLSAIKCFGYNRKFLLPRVRQNRLRESLPKWKHLDFPV